MSELKLSESWGSWNWIPSPHFQDKGFVFQIILFVVVVVVVGRRVKS